MTQSEFIEYYCANSKIKEQTLNDSGNIAVVCNCGEADCKGWAYVNKKMLLDHINLYIKI